MERAKMNDKEQIVNLIDKFTDLQRIKASEDRDEEIEYQIKATKAKLQAFGIATEDLQISK